MGKIPAFMSRAWGGRSQEEEVPDFPELDADREQQGEISLLVCLGCGSSSSARSHGGEIEVVVGEIVRSYGAEEGCRVIAGDALPWSQ